MKDQPLPGLKVEKGPALDEYLKASKRLAAAILPRMGDMRNLRAMAANGAFRQAEIAALVEFLVDSKGKKELTTEEFLRRVADCMNKQAEGAELQNLSIFIPGRG
jgi:hypothetical protein